jgi:hypothetical protein
MGIALTQKKRPTRISILAMHIDQKVPIEARTFSAA